MIRVCILCEGQTEKAFVDECLAPLLQTSSIYIHAELLGGNVSTQRIARFVRGSIKSVQYITTFVDFYGFKNNNATSREALESEILTAVQALFKNQDITQQFRPYVQMYEFEGLLFTDVNEFEWVQDAWNDEKHQQLQIIRDEFENPETINNSKETAPSKRLEAIFGKQYCKVEHGPIIADSIGVQRIREACPNFHEWLSWLESLGTAPTKSE